MHRLISLAAFALTCATASAFAAPPDGLVLSRTTIAENESPYTLIGIFTTLDPDPGDTHRYVLVENPLDLFEIQGDRLVAVQSLDYEAGPQKQIKVRAYDSTNAWIERTFTITILDRNDPPLGATLSTTGTPETTPIFGLVGTVTQFGDPDQNDAWTYRLIDDAQGRFVLEGNQLRTSSLLDFETNPVHQITVEAKDRAGAKGQSVILINVWDRNEPPQGVVLSPSLVSEAAASGTTIGSLTALGDPDFGDTHTFILVGGDPGFAIEGVLLKVASRLDFEANPARTIRVRVTDRGGLFVETSVTVFLSDAPEPPTGVRLVGAALPENAPTGTLAGVLEALDPDVGDTHMFELADTADSGRFLIEGNQLVALIPFDFETQATVQLRVRVTDASGLSTVATLTIPIRDVNEAPTDIRLTTSTVYETASNNTIIGFLSVLDPDAADAHELFLLQDGNGSFRIEGRTLRKSGPLDFETAPTVTVSIIAFDRAGLFFIKTFSIEVLDVDEPATGIAVDPPSVAENQPIGTVVGALIPVGDPDQDKGYTWFLVENPGNRFAIVDEQLVTNQVFNYEGTRTYQIRIRAIPDVGTPIEQNITIDIRDEPEPPTTIAISGNVVQENRAAGTFVATLSAQGDPDAGDQHTFSLTENPGEAFSVQGNTLSTAKILDHETRSTYPLKVRATDRAGLFVDVPVEVRVLDVNEPPTGVSLSNSTIAEHSPANSVVGRLAPVGDPDLVDRYSYSFSSNPEDRFDIVGDTLIARAPFDFETPPTSFRIVVRVADQGNLTAESVLFVTTTNVNERPTPITLARRELAENAPAGTVVDTIGGGLDPDIDDVSNFEILEGEGFAVDSERRLIATRPFDHETEPSIDVTVRLTDGGGLSVQATWTIAITNVPEPPTAVTLSNLTVHESALVGDVVGELAAIGDPDADEAHTFRVSADPDAVFKVVERRLALKRAVDYEKQRTHQVSITATDKSGLTVTTSFTIEVLDDNDRPTSRADFALTPIDEDFLDEMGVTGAELMEGLAASDVDGDEVRLLVSNLGAEGDVAGLWERLDGETWAPLAVDASLGVADRIRFLPAPDAYGTARLVVRAFDGELAGGPAEVTRDVVAINDAPVHALGEGRIDTSEQATTRVAEALGAPLAVSDVDADVLQVTLTAPRGTLTLPTTDLTVIAGDVGTTTVTLEGTKDALNAALAALELLPAPRFVGETELLVTSDDLGQSGSGGPRQTTDSIPVFVSAGPDLVVLHDDEEVSTGGRVIPERLGVGAFHHLRFNLENRGSRPLHLDPSSDDVLRGNHGLAVLRADNADAWLSVRPDLDLAAGQVTSAVVTVRPRAAGPVSVELGIDSDDPATPRWRATVGQSAVLAPDLVVHDGVREVHGGLAHRVAELTPGQTRRIELELDNVGSARLELFEALVSRSEGVEVILEEPFPILDPGETDLLVVYLTAPKSGRARAAIEVPTTDPDAPGFEIDLVAEVVASPSERLVLERVPGVILPAGPGDDIGYGRVGRDLGLALRLTNLGGRASTVPAVSVGDVANAIPRLALGELEPLAPGASAEFSLFLRPEAVGPFSVGLTVGGETWSFQGRAIGANEAVPGNAIALYRHGGGRVATTDALGPVDANVARTHAWILVNEGPEPLSLAHPVAIARRQNVDAWPVRQPSPQLQAQRSVLLPLAIEPLSSGRVELDLLPAGYPETLIASDGQVGLIALELDSGQRLAPNGVVQLPVQVVGGPIELVVWAVNDGNGSLDLDPPTLSGGESCVGVSTPNPEILGPGERTRLVVSLLPVTGTFACTLAVPSNDASRPTFEVAFVARGTNVGKRDDGCGSGPLGMVLVYLVPLVFVGRRYSYGRRTRR